MQYKLNSGKIISGNIKTIVILHINPHFHPLSAIMQSWNREIRDAYTKAMHAGYFVQIHLSTNNRMFSITHYDWCDKQMEFSEWIQEHAID